jgi:hypothetical protein
LLEGFNLSSAVSVLSVVAAGLFAFYKWREERRQAMAERRFEQYWKLLQTATESEYVAQQKAAV